MAKMLILLTMLLMGCGAQREVTPLKPIPTATPQPGGITFADVQAITSQSCARCHSSDPFLKTEAAWRASQAKTRLSNGSMPPAGTNEARNLSPGDRQKLISF